ncbi:hypothetical protein QR680_010905 [Steinernema hermaphroditum]|uniref:Ig-like domain-containing protein n=1 Tax=Steinernema hermaphroditum TaxID=289476 RepID=A0AA39MCG3_9BILA|nr:hypothetical protein QR680_010905 [Steinernema hermaphroditum]
MDQINLLVLLIGFLAASSHGQYNLTSISAPPRFTHRPNAPLVYFTPSDVKSQVDKPPTAGMILRCEAVGNPDPSYIWKKDGKPLPLDNLSDRITLASGGGSLIFWSVTVEDEGDYQCEASNGNGIAVSETIRLQSTQLLRNFGTNLETVDIELGDSYTRTCSAPHSVPQAKVYWILKGKSGGNFETLNASHVSVNDEGTIFFHHVTDTDIFDKLFFTCAAETLRLTQYKFGNQFRFNIKKNKRQNMDTVIPPAEMYVGQSAPVAVSGTTHKLSCFFSGYPVPTPTWHLNGKEITKSDGYAFDDYGRTVKFEASTEKGGQYECRFPDQPEINRNFEVVVESAPRWLTGAPESITAAEGDAVTFRCQVEGNPSPMVTFYKNGVAITESIGSWNISGSSLTIQNAKRDVDRAVYQCKAENKHGHLWANFYLNILEPSALFDPQAYPLNNRSLDEKAVVLLRWKNPIKSLEKVTIHRCLTDENLCLSPIEVSANQNRIRLSGLDHDKDYRIVIAGKDEDFPIRQSVDVRTLPVDIDLTLNPEAPSLLENGVEENLINVTFLPGKYRKESNRPIGHSHYFMIRPASWVIRSEWRIIDGNSDNFEQSLTGLEPGTQYEIVAVSMQKTYNGSVLETHSDVCKTSTPGKMVIVGTFSLPYLSTAGTNRNQVLWIMVIFAATLFVFTTLGFACVWARRKGAIYAVSSKERRYGTDAKSVGAPEGFAEFGHDHKRLISETESEDSKKSIDRFIV